MIELVIFDADGVLFDSERSNVAYYNYIFEQVGEPPLDSGEEVKAISYAAAEVFAARARGDSEKLRQMHAVTRSMDQTRFFNMLRPPLELRSFMLELKRRYRVGLATNRSATVPALIVHLGLADVFDAVASVLDKVAPKPAPDILHLCMKRAGVSANRAVYVGDSEIDREAADAAGVHFIAVGHRVEHHRRIPTIADLPAKLEALARSLG